MWTKAELQEQIAAWKAALLAVSQGKSYSIGNRELVRQDVPEIRNTLKWLKEELDAIDGNSGPVFVAGRVSR